MDSRFRGNDRGKNWHDKWAIENDKGKSKNDIRTFPCHNLRPFLVIIEETFFVIPLKKGIHDTNTWIPAFAGMTRRHTVITNEDR